MSLVVLAAVISVVGGMRGAWAGMSHVAYTWTYVNSPNSYNKPAGTCTFIYPEYQPFAQARELIVDNHLPNGSVLYSWDYNNFLPNFGWSCTSSGVSSWGADHLITDAGIIPGSSGYIYATYLRSAIELSPGIYKTSVEGIGVKFYLKISDETTYNIHQGHTGINAIEGTGFTTPPGSEFTVSGVTTFYVRMSRFPESKGTSGNFTYTLKGTAKYSIRAELIKTGDITITSPIALSVVGASNGYVDFNSMKELNGLSRLPGPLAGSGILIYPAACRLRGAADYQIDLGRWVDLTGNNIGSLPAQGNIKPVNISLECSGKLDNVEFSFQDTGDSPLTNRNISLYDNIGGQKIEGLEVEMLYNGTRLNVHKMGEATTTYKTNTGAHGSIKTNPSDITFNSQSSASFAARFVQRNVIKRNGVAYAGPVTGKVNMFVTYY